jgi:hypothetical protein
MNTCDQEFGLHYLDAGEALVAPAPELSAPTPPSTRSKPGRAGQSAQRRR